MTIYDTHQVEFKTIRTRINTLLSDKLISHESQSLIHLLLSQKFYLDQFEINESYTDGGNDCGVDAVYIDQRPDQPLIHIFQSKVHSSERKSRAPFKASVLEKLSRFFEITGNRELELSKIVNPKLEQKIREIRLLQDRSFPVFKVWLISNGKYCVAHEIEPLFRTFRSLDITLEEFHLDDFIEFCINERSKRSNHVFYAREAGVVEFGSSELRSIVGYISARELYDLLRDLRDERRIDYSVFDKNVRGYLGLNNPINREIHKSASSSENEFFSALNNGITIVGSQCKILKAGSDRKKIGLKNMSIVNGAQTCSAIFDAMKDYYPDLDKFDDLSVLFRVFQTDDKDQISRIALTSNNQTRINPRDLRANEEEQYKLEKELKNKGIQYFRKRGEIGNIKKSGRKLDALRAGQLLLSYVHLEPAKAKKESDSIFSDMYPKIFGAVDANKLVEALDFYELIEEKKNYIADEIRLKGIKRTDDTFVTYGHFHILTLCSLIQDVSAEVDKEQLIDKAIDLIADDLRSSGEPAYYTYFRDTRVSERLKSKAMQDDFLDILGINT